MNITDKLNFLQIQEVTTDKQKANGTREFKLPVCDQYGAAIHVASFASGYVRRTKAGGYCPSWQLNKTRTIQPTKDYRWPSKERILILDEQERLEYLIAFCLKNYYINQSNKLSNGDYIPKWKHEEVKERYDVDQDLEVKVIVNGHRYNVI
tara:strand:+ start:484 stop:936 length:453 start_codon:yes stop_codon:yes gene_type:complete